MLKPKVQLGNERYSTRNTGSSAIRDVVKLMKTDSFSDSFKGRLEWKGRHYDKPITSTPVPNKKVGPTKTKKSNNILFNLLKVRADVDISPIKKLSPLKEKNNFSHLLHKYKCDEDDKGEAGTRPFHTNVEPGKIKTYQPKKISGDKPLSIEKKEVKKVTHSVKFCTTTRKISSKGKTKVKISIGGQKVQVQPAPNKSTGKCSTNTKPNDEPTNSSNKQKKLKVGPKKEKIDMDVADWMAKTNQEFQDVENFPLIVE